LLILILGIEGEHEGGQSGDGRLHSGGLDPFESAKPLFENDAQRRPEEDSHSEDDRDPKEDFVEDGVAAGFDVNIVGEKVPFFRRGFFFGRGLVHQPFRVFDQEARTGLVGLENRFTLLHRLGAAKSAAEKEK
jgi:hypothetical protein